MDGVQLRGGSLLFPTESSGLLDTHLIDIGGMKDWDDLEATQEVLKSQPLDWESSALTTRPGTKKYPK